MSDIPHHIACIMDGNGRWAKQRGLPRREGHRKGADTVQRCVDLCLEYRIPWLTLYAFSSENWNRPFAEVATLMILLNRFLKEKTPQMMRQNVRLHVIGDIGRLPKKTRTLLAEAMEQTKNNTALNVVLALSYGSRGEITGAAKKLVRKVQEGTLRFDQINEEIFAAELDTAGMPDPDLLIRSSGELRLSNFLLWQLSYAEIHVTPCLWPDFDRPQFLLALEDYVTRHRRFGSLS